MKYSFTVMTFLLAQMPKFVVILVDENEIFAVA
jgi:hypothetical protein